MSSDEKSLPRTVFRQYIFLKKRPDFTDEEFHKYWARHRSIISSLNVYKKNVVRYETITTPASGPFIAWAGDTNPTDDVEHGWTAIAVLDYHDENAYRETVTSDEWKQNAAADNPNFLDDKNVKRVATYVDIQHDTWA